MNKWVEIAQGIKEKKQSIDKTTLNRELEAFESCLTRAKQDGNDCIEIFRNDMSYEAWTTLVKAIRNMGFKVWTNDTASRMQVDVLSILPREIGKWERGLRKAAKIIGFASLQAGGFWLFSELNRADSFIWTLIK